MRKKTIKPRYLTVDIKGAIIYISSEESLTRKDGSYILAGNGDHLLKRYIIIKGKYEDEFKVEALGTKASRRYWLSVLAQYKIGTWIIMKVRIKSYSWMLDTGKSDLKNILMPVMYDSGVPFKVLWKPGSRGKTVEIDEAPF